MKTPTLRAALRLAELGLYVFPVHNAIFNDDGACVGCTCESYRHSEQCKRNHPHLYLNEDERCPSPGKCPRVKWREKSTRSEMQIRRWAEMWPGCNWGIDTGKSGLIVVDLDIEKPGFDGGDLLDLLDAYPTWQVMTGGGGYHFIYRSPEGATFTNSPGNLPEGVDVRANGGYIVAPHSIHRSGRRYQFAFNAEPKNRALAELPEPLQILLEDAERRAAERRQDFASYHAPATLERGAELLQRLKPHRADDYFDWVTVGMALRFEYGDAGLALWDSWSAISAKYRPNECARKWQTFNGRGVTLGTLAWMADQDEPRPDPTGGFRRWLGATRQFVKSTSFEAYIAPDLQSITGYRTDSTDTKTADALLDLAEQHGRRAFTLRLDDLRRLAGLGSKETARLSLLRLGGWFAVVDEAGIDGTQVRIVYAPVVSTLDDSTNTVMDDEQMVLSSNVETTALPDYSRDKSLGAYLSGVTVEIRKRLAADGMTPKEAVERGLAIRGLGETVLRVADALATYGAMTRRDLAAATGKAVSAISTAARRMATLGLVTVERADRFAPTVIRLAEDFTEQVKGLYPSMTTYKLDLERARRDVETRLHWLSRRLRGAKAAVAKTIERKIARERQTLVELLEVLHEDWSADERQQWADEEFSQSSKRFAAQQRAERNEPESDASILANLAHYRRKAFAKAA